ncbi:hypothetical protein YC2023_014756 [Brassica napus]
MVSNWNEGGIRMGGYPARCSSTFSEVRFFCIIGAYGRGPCPAGGSSYGSTQGGEDGV